MKNSFNARTRYVFVSRACLTRPHCANDLRLQGCSKAHVSPQQRDPKSSIRIPSMAVAATPIVAPSAPHGASISPSPNLTACRFGAHCTRADCHFTHPWGAKPSPGGDPAEVGKDGSNPAFSTIRCKFGLACTRRELHLSNPCIIDLEADTQVIL